MLVIIALMLDPRRSMMIIIIGCAPPRHRSQPSLGHFAVSMAARPADSCIAVVVLGIFVFFCMRNQSSKQHRRLTLLDQQEL